MLPPTVCWMRSKLIGTTGVRSRPAEPVIESCAFLVRLRYSLEAGEFVLVIFVAGADDVTGFLSPIDLSDFGRGGGCAGRALVGKKVVLESINDRPRDLLDIAPAAERHVIFHYRDDLVVGFVVVEHAQTTNRNG